LRGLYSVCCSSTLRRLFAVDVSGVYGWLGFNTDRWHSLDVLQKLHGIGLTKVWCSRATKVERQGALFRTDARTEVNYYINMETRVRR
jgi:hypothetical protein